MQAVEDHPDIRFWTTRYCSQKTMRVIPSSIIGYLSVASEIHGRTKLNEFVEKLGSGIGLMEGEPALLLRERFVDMSARKLSIARSMANALIIKAINSHMKDKRLGILRWRDGEAYPVIE